MFISLAFSLEIPFTIFAVCLAEPKEASSTFPKSNDLGDTPLFTNLPLRTSITAVNLKLSSAVNFISSFIN